MIAFFLCASVGMTQVVLRITNPSSFERRDELVAVPWRVVRAAWPGIVADQFTVTDPVSGKQFPFQLEYAGKEKIQNLLIQVSVPAKGHLRLRLQKGTPETFAAQTYCRYVPERKDDFAWENDKIAFRAYGKALENTSENAWGFDVWVKRTSSLVINDRYKGNDYHKDHGDGLDYYSVGATLGAGGIAPFVNDSIWYSANYHHWKVLDNGPLRSTFQLQYDEWNVANRKVKLTLTMSIDAGAQVHKVVAVYTSSDTKPLPVAVGIVQRGQQGQSRIDPRNGIAAYWEPTDPKNGTTGVGCIFRGKVTGMSVQKGQLLTLLLASPGKPLVYYRGAAWDKAGEIQSAEQWEQYLILQQKKIQQPLRMNIGAGKG